VFAVLGLEVLDLAVIAFHGSHSDRSDQLAASACRAQQVRSVVARSDCCSAVHHDSMGCLQCYVLIVDVMARRL
jgi:hypothetical protein